jgi:sialic acid synthase SpsE
MGTMKTFVIGECASAHDGHLEKALRLIDAAADAGCSAAKFQYWSSAFRLADRRRAPEYIATYLKYQVRSAWLPSLKAHADSRGIELMVTTFLPEDVGIVDPFVNRFKVSSFEATNRELVAAHEPFGKPLIVSLGMADVADVMNLDFWYRDAHYLQCTSAYPCSADELNLAVIRDLGLDGLSDHSGLVETGAMAVASGARILEVHLKLPDTDPTNPDAGDFALLPDALADYVAFVRQAELMMGDGVKRIMPSEHAMARYQVRA